MTPSFPGTISPAGLDQLHPASFPSAEYFPGEIFTASTGLIRSKAAEFCILLKSVPVNVIDSEKKPANRDKYLLFYIQMITDGNRSGFIRTAFRCHSGEWGDDRDNEVRGRGRHGSFS
jgi:hypothetical protein